MDPYLIPPIAGAALLVGGLIAVAVGRAHVAKVRREEERHSIAAE